MARDHQDDITHDGSMYAIYLDLRGVRNFPLPLERRKFTLES